MSNLLQSISDASFENDVIASTVPVLVDFWAEWCGPCKALTPILEELATHYGDRVKIVKLNVDQNTSTPAKFGIRGIPTVILFKSGQVAGTKVGLSGKADLIKWVDGLIS